MVNVFRSFPLPQSQAAFKHYKVPRFATFLHPQRVFHEPIRRTAHSVDPLFQRAKNNHEEEKLLDKKHLRDIRKNQKFEAKKIRLEKSQTRATNLSVIVPEVKKIRGKDILSILYSQDSIKCQTQEGMPLHKLIESMKTQGWKRGTHITVVRMPDGKLVSMDNRRLFAAKQTYHQTKNETFTVEINQFKHDDKAPKKLLSGVISEYKRGRQLSNINNLSQGILSGTYGHCVLLRIHTRQGSLNSGRFGYPTDPCIRND